ncbi:hypothetical protein KY329_00680 [Candidatus Woesearchaeota archaeon]|nr:hypothetical protein [Candidatus Woesearchaeota archaeon]
MKPKDMLVDFIEKSAAFDNDARLKLLLVVSGVKPATFVPLRITPRNLDDKYHFEKHLKEAGFKFTVTKPRSFEEISKIKKNLIYWRMKGIWYGFDIFRNDKVYADFKRYKKLSKAGRYKQADVIGGKIYGYPSCCVKEFIRERDPKFIAKKYTYGQYFKRLQDIETKYPFIVHTPCNKCKASENLNNKYRAAIKKIAPKFYRQFTKKQKLIMPIIINFENDLMLKGTSIWPEKKMHNYTAISKKPIDKKYYLISFLTKNHYVEGDVVKAELTMQYNWISVREIKRTGYIRHLAHERKFSV